MRNKQIITQYFNKGMKNENEFLVFQLYRFQSMISWKGITNMSDMIIGIQPEANASRRIG